MAAPPRPIVSPTVEAVVLLRAARAALSRAEEAAPGDLTLRAAADDVAAALAKLEASAVQPDALTSTPPNPHKGAS
jgi:hypothetical protein